MFLMKAQIPIMHKKLKDVLPLCVFIVYVMK